MPKTDTVYRRRKTCLRLAKSNSTLKAVNGTNVEHLGYIEIPLQFDGSNWIEARFYVCDIDGP